jgi:hypothetical protein
MLMPVKPCSATTPCPAPRRNPRSERRRHHQSGPGTCVGSWGRDVAVQARRACLSPLAGLSGEGAASVAGILLPALCVGTLPGVLLITRK